MRNAVVRIPPATCVGLKGVNDMTRPIADLRKRFVKLLKSVDFFFLNSLLGSAIITQNVI
jgi:hypothetical protein